MAQKEKHIDPMRLRAAAAMFMDTLVSGVHGKKRDYREHMVACYLFVQDRPVSVYEIAKQPYAGSYRTAKRITDGLVSKGMLEITEGGVRLTELGSKAGEIFFTALYNLHNDVEALFSVV
jgi:predicted transcriptional regulator